MNKNYKEAINYYERFLETKPKDIDLSEIVRAPGKEEFYYLFSSKRILELKEELFFKEGN